MAEARNGSARKNSANFSESSSQNSPREIARLRRLRGKAILCMDDAIAFSESLVQEFPEAVYFFANYKTGKPTPSKFTDEIPVVLFKSLEAAIHAAIIVEKQKPIHNGPDFNRPDIICRLAWPEQLVSQEPNQLIGGRSFPDETRDLAIQYRQLGRWFRFHFPTQGYQFICEPTGKRGVWRFDLERKPGQAYLPFQVLDNVQSEFFSLYDSCDEETSDFAKRTYALWRRLYTTQVACYDPLTHELVASLDSNSSYSWNIGKRALENALSEPHRYAGFAPKSAEDGSPLMLGPRPTTRKKGAED